MWRKILSNRDPGDTVFSELKKEFRPWVTAVNGGTSKLLSGYPRFFFGVMILLMLVSAGLSFTVFRNREKPVHETVGQEKKPSPVEDGFRQIMKTTGELQQTIRLKHMVDSLTAKQQLTPADSTALESALNRLQHINPLK